MAIDAGYKLVLLLKSVDVLEPDDFTHAWVEQERQTPTSSHGLLRTAFGGPSAHASPVASGSPFDAVLETWWDKKNSAADWVTSREFREAWLPRRLELLASRPTAVGGIPHALRTSEQTAGLSCVKVVVLPVSSGRLRFHEFTGMWTGDHARLALAGAGTAERVLQLEYTPAPLNPPSIFNCGPYSGVGAITFASMEAVTAELESDYYRTTVAPDEARFTDAAASASFVTVEVALA